jgi:arginine/lysine/ornithine decarboxylase
VTFLVDEAWFAFAYFHPFYRPYTAMSAARAVAWSHTGKKFAVVATQSAHKSLSAMRQGSYIHLHGDEALIRKFKETQFAFHTTSPSYPILASLELARAQAVSEGFDQIDNALRLARRIREEVQGDPDLAVYTLNESSELVDACTLLDPLRISIDVGRVTDNVKAFKEFLFAEHGVCVNHVTRTAFLVNVHIGVSETGVQRLLRGMRQFARAAAERKAIEPLAA